jgi:hypothetical protein
MKYASLFAMGDFSDISGKYEILIRMLLDCTRIDFVSD